MITCRPLLCFARGRGMASLSPASRAAIARLRSYVPPPTSWYALPLSRRAAVLILLFPDQHGELRVVLTMRATTLKSYAGQAALPGGKTDELTESPLATARREAHEEIGLPLPGRVPPAASSGGGDVVETKHSPDTPGLPYPFRLEHLCQLPTNLAKTELGVRPVVAFLYATSPVDHDGKAVDVQSMLVPRLDAKEVAAVFSGPFHNFLKTDDEILDGTPKPDGQWYKGSWTDWYKGRFRMHNFYVPVHAQTVTKPRKNKRQKAESDDGRQDPRAIQMHHRSDDVPDPKKPLTVSPSSLSSSTGEAEGTQWATGLNLSASLTPSENLTANDLNPQNYPRPSRFIPYRDIPERDDTARDPLDDLQRFRVFGMTARILVDCARVAYAQEPEFEHNSHFGDEGIIRMLIEAGRMDKPRRRGGEFTSGEVEHIVSGVKL